MQSALAFARDHGEIRVGPSQQVVVKDFPGLPLTSGQSAAQTASTRTPQFCMSSLYCDTIVFFIDNPSGGFFRASIYLYWDGAPANDYNLYLHEGEDQDKDGTQDELMDSSISLRDSPEVIHIDTAGRYQLVVLNRAGNGPPYRIRAEFVQSEIPLLPPSSRNRPSSPQTPSSSTVPEAAAYTPLPSDFSAEIKPVVVAQREVETYGADSNPVAMGLKTLGTNERKTSGSGVWPWAIFGAALLILLGLGFIGYIRFLRPRMHGS